MGLDDLDLREFVDQAAAAIGEESRALAENIGRNLTESVRQPRNALEAAVNARQTLAEISDATDLDMAPQNQRNTQASFENHLKAIMRQTASELGRKLQSTQFMGLSLDGPLPSGTGAPATDPAPIIPLEEFAADNHANLGPHPHSSTLAVPIPKGYEDVAPVASKLVKLKPRDRALAIVEMLRAQAGGIPADEE